jgi:copper chaperone CopZ
MKKIYNLEELDCPNCSAKMEKAIRGVDGVKSASINFMALKLTLEAEDEVFDEVLKKAVKAAKRAVPECRILV